MRGAYGLAILGVFLIALATQAWTGEHGPSWWFWAAISGVGGAVVGHAVDKAYEAGRSDR